MSTSEISPEFLNFLMEGPALSPPEGVKSNFVNPYSFGKGMFIGELTLYILTTLIVAIRIYTKLRILRKMAFNDYVLLLGWAMSFAIVLLIPFAPENTLGTHQYNVQLKKISKFIYLVHIASIIYGIANVLIKSSILLQYMTIFAPSKNGYFFRSCQGLIALNLVVYTILVFVEIFTCIPRAKIWNVFLPGKCLNYRIGRITTGVINVLSDLIIVGLPQGIIWKLHMSFRRKLGVSLIFAIGLFACVAGILRLTFTIILSHNDDATWYTSLMALFGMTELSFGTITSCLPSLAKAFNSFSQTGFMTRMYSLLARSRSKGTGKESSGWSHPFQRKKESGRREGIGEGMDSVDGFVRGIEMNKRNEGKVGMNESRPGSNRETLVVAVFRMFGVTNGIPVGSIADNGFRGRALSSFDSRESFGSESMYGG
ncbi:hypothetical protein HYALB_00001672 [Hymenoscyphus albidus]|uniref:Rhodopsin domain-containing protein n=1 Tax=Hymenoscyphus albidus TaxID=595503 RepID=A0A9N9LBP0_9HELO|nr:hypothetical protein HYALB_00001672 [Hymenoscyphus albidus]